MMNRRTIGLALLAMPLMLLGCNDVSKPIYGRNDPFIRAHVHFGSEHLQDSTAVESATSTRDPAGLVHVTVQVRSTEDHDQKIDAYCAFFRGGQVIDELGPQQVFLHAQVYANVQFNSTQPADDFSITLSEMK